MEIGLSLGSNSGDRFQNLKEAKSLIGSIPKTHIVAVSSVYETEAVDVTPEFQALSFLNTFLIIETEGTLSEVAEHLFSIEKRMGRERKNQKNIPRHIDIDIIYANDIRINTPLLSVPHPRWRNRRFVVEPLAELRPHKIIIGETLEILQILATIPRKPACCLFCSEW